MSEQLLCWRCGKPLTDLILPMSRREECAACGADQHVCKMCKDYAPTLADACREDRADRVSDKERANFCDYFSPSANAFQGAYHSQEEESRRQLAQLFGDDEPAPAGAEINAENGGEKSGEAPLSASDAALAELEKLFGKD